jgi:hypothetical protein
MGGGEEKVYRRAKGKKKVRDEPTAVDLAITHLSTLVLPTHCGRLDPSLFRETGPASQPANHPAQQPGQPNPAASRLTPPKSTCDLVFSS